MLFTKIHIPGTVDNIVHRTALFDILNMGLRRRLILVSAPAGYGKTTLLCDWISQEKVQTAWFSIGKGDNDPVDFIGYIIAAITRIHKEFGQNTLRLLKIPGKPGNQAIINLLINEIIEIKQHFLLVFDDFHWIENSETIEIVAYLIDHIPDHVHVVICTRSDPPLSVAKLRSQHQLVELRSSDLSFSAFDIAVLFNKKLKMGLSPDDIESLEAKTEGWIAGLQLTALSMQAREDVSGFIRDFKSDDRFIMDYLMEEVLKIQPDHIREFLLQTSLLEQMSAPLCNAVLNRNDSQEILETLGKSNMFIIPLDAGRKWYRYHHLFANLLNQRLLDQDPTILQELHYKACDWFEQNQMHELALEHALRIPDYERSIQIFGERVERMWETGLHASILKYGDLIPDELILKNPGLGLYYSWILITSGQIQKAESILSSAEKELKKDMEVRLLSGEALERSRKLLGRISVASAYLNVFTTNSDKVLDYARTAFTHLPVEDSLWLGWLWYSTGMAEMTNGNLESGKRALENSLENCKISNNLYLISTVGAVIAYHEYKFGRYKSAFRNCSDILKYMKANGYLQVAKTEWTYSALFTMMSVVQCIWADYDEALEHVKTAYDLCKNQKNIGQKIMALLAYSYILYAREERTEALNRLAELEEVMKKYKVSPFTTVTYVGWKLRVLIDSDQLDEASHFAHESGLGLDKKISFKDEHAYIFYVRLLLAQHKFTEAESLLSELYALAQSGQRLETLVYLKILNALFHEMTGDQKKALSSLTEAMELAADENMVNYFLFDLSYTHDLLTEVFNKHATGETNIPDSFIGNLKSALEKRNSLRIIAVNTIISARELDALKLVAQGLSNQEVADRLFVSLNTVKTHLKNIFVKLEVENRSNAVARAKELGIV